MKKSGTKLSATATVKTTKKEVRKVSEDENETVETSRKSKKTELMRDAAESRPKEISADTEELVFEDPFEDEFEDEEVDEDEINEDIDENEELDNEKLPTIEEDVEGAAPLNEKSNIPPPPKKVWRPDVDKIDDGEALDYDPSAYVMYHSLQTEWPCLSFDIIKDTLGDNRQRVLLFVSHPLTLCDCLLFSTVSSFNVYGHGIASRSSQQK